MIMQQFGTTEFTNVAAKTANRVRLSEGPLDLSWHHCSTTSDFIGDFFALQAAEEAGVDENEARHSIGYLVNELVENAVKFRAPGDVLIESSLDKTNFEIKVANLIAGETAERFQALLSEIVSRDAGELLIERIEQNAADPDSGASGLGLLTLMSDYGVRLGWKFLRDSPDGPVRLETYAALTLS